MFCTCTLSGRTFIPYNTVLPEQITLISMYDKGMIGQTGRNKNRTITSGVLHIKGGFDDMLDFLETIYTSDEFMNIDDIDLTINVSFTSQCNFELNSFELQRLARLNITVGITCYAAE